MPNTSHHEKSGLDDPRATCCAFVICEVSGSENGQTEDLRVLEANAEFSKWAGHSAESLQGQSLLSLFPEAERAWRTILEEMREKKAVLQCGVKLSGPLESANIHAFDTGSRHITLLFHSAQTPGTDGKSFENAGGPWKKILDALPQAICVVDDSHHILYVNRMMAEMMGQCPEELEGACCTQLIHGTNAPPALCPHVRTSLDGKAHIAEIYSETLNGWFAVSTAPLLNGSAESHRSVHVMREITREKREEQERMHSERRRQEAEHLESLGVLAGAIAHDFNNILAGILGYANLSAVETPANSPIRRYLGHIERGVERAAELCKQMLAYAGKTRLEFRPIDLGGLIEEMLPLFKSSVSSRARFQYFIEKPIPPVAGDFSQIGQALLNIVINSSEALGDEEGTITLSAGAAELTASSLAEAGLTGHLPEGRYAVVEIADDGAGMEEHTVQRIFEPFFSTKFQGRGLGMSAVFGIIRRHGGGLKVLSEPGRGTLVRVFLPATFPSGQETA